MKRKNLEIKTLKEAIEYKYEILILKTDEKKLKKLFASYMVSECDIGLAYANNFRTYEQIMKKLEGLPIQQVNNYLNSSELVICRKMIVSNDKVLRKRVFA